MLGRNAQVNILSALVVTTEAVCEVRSEAEEKVKDLNISD